MLVPNYVTNHNQSIFYGISLYICYRHYIYSCVSIWGSNNCFPSFFWPHTYTNKSKLSIILVFLNYINNSSGIKKLSHIILVNNWRYKDTIVPDMVHTHHWYYHLGQGSMLVCLYPVVELWQLCRYHEPEWHGLFVSFGRN